MEDATMRIERNNAIDQGWRSRLARSRHLFAPIVATALVVTGCASPPPKPESMRDPQANFSSYNTFGWAVAGRPRRGAPGAAPVGLLDGQLRTAISAELQKRGYRGTDGCDSGSAHLVRDRRAGEDREQSRARIGIGVGGYGNNGGASVGVGSSSVRNVREGTLVIHAIETARNAEVWQGRFAAKMNKGSVDQARVNSAVAMTMQDFPRVSEEADNG
jgi:hypothetical protein